MKIENSERVSPYVEMDGTYYRFEDLKNCPESWDAFKFLNDDKFLKEVEDIIKRGVSVWFNPNLNSGMTASVIPKDNKISAELCSSEGKEPEILLIITPKADYCVLKHEQVHIHEQKVKGHYSSNKNPPFELPSEEEFDERAALINYLNEVAAHDEHLRCLKETNQSTENLILKFNYLYRNRLKRRLSEIKPEVRDYLCKSINQIHKSENFSVCD